MEVVLARADYLRHCLPAGTGAATAPAAAALRAFFPAAAELMASYFPDYTDRALRLPGYWAHVEAVVLKDAAAARAVWEGVLKSSLSRRASLCRGRAQRAAVWQYAGSATLRPTRARCSLTTSGFPPRGGGPAAGVSSLFSGRASRHPTFKRRHAFPSCHPSAPSLPAPGTTSPGRPTSQWSARCGPSLRCAPSTSARGPGSLRRAASWRCAMTGCASSERRAGDGAAGAALPP
jgi:hypothetical protein